MLASLGAYDICPIRSLTQEDPLGLAGGLNLYGYANGAPVNFSDPFGLCPPADPSRTDDCRVILNGATLSNPVLRERLQTFATDVVGHDVELNGPCSGDRTPACNTKVHGDPNSPHLTDEAAD